MIWMTTRRAAVTVALLAGSLAACGTLDVSDPTAIQQSELDNANGANLLRMDALRQFYVAYTAGVKSSALLTDEAFADTPAIFQQWGISNIDEVVDRRKSVAYESQGGTLYGQFQRLRTAATVAIPGLRTFVGPERVGEMFATRGYATLMLGELICPGFPLHKLVDLKPVYGGPLTTAEVFENALADLDSALELGADSTRITSWARVGRARVLLDLGRYAEAATAASAVPVTYVQNAEYSTAGNIYIPNDLGRGLYAGDYSGNLSLADSEGSNGLDFAAANDPRVKANPGRLASNGVTQMYTPGKYPTTETSIAIASGIEARLIEAEAALAAGDVTTWRDKLNEPRRNAWSTIVPAVSGPLADLPDPGNDAARLALTYRERAFWLWGTAHRLGDLRRLITQYGQSAESLYPTGAYRMGDFYEAATSIPFPASLETPYSPTVTGCTSR